MMSSTIGDISNYRPPRYLNNVLNELPSSSRNTVPFKHALRSENPLGALLVALCSAALGSAGDGINAALRDLDGLQFKSPQPLIYYKLFEGVSQLPNYANRRANSPLELVSLARKIDNKVGRLMGDNIPKTRKELEEGVRVYTNFLKKCSASERSYGQKKLKEYKDALAAIGGGNTPPPLKPGFGGPNCEAPKDGEPITRDDSRKRAAALRELMNKFGDFRIPVYEIKKGGRQELCMMLISDFLATRVISGGSAAASRGPNGPDFRTMNPGKLVEYLLKNTDLISVIRRG